VAREFTDDRGGDREGVAVLSVSWSSNGRRLVSAAADGSVTVWDVEEAGAYTRPTSQLNLSRFCHSKYIIHPP
jgi:WD40 repeat protein